MANFEVRVFSEDAGDYRILPGKLLAPGVEWRISRSEGYAEATLPLFGDALTDGQFAGVVTGRRVEFWTEGNRLYRGYIRRIEPQEADGETPAQSKVTLYGRYQLIGSQRVQKRFAVYEGRDAGLIIADALDNFVRPFESVPLSVDSAITGQELLSMDAWDIPFSEAVSRVIDVAGGFLVAGCDVDSQGLDRFFLRSFSLSDTARHVLTIPSRAIGTKETSRDDTDTVNTIYVQGGDARFPNLVAQAVKNNTSFEYPVLSEDDTGNRLDNPDFENVSPTDLITGNISDWTENGTPNLRRGEQGYGSPHAGRYFVRFNASGDKITQANNPDTSVVVGSDYSFSVWARKIGNAPNPVMTLRIVWLNSGGGTISTEELSFVPRTSNNYESKSVPGRAPALATGYRVEAEMTTSGGEGIALDSASFIKTSGVTSLGWECVPLGTATLTTMDWAYEGVPPYHGAYSVLIGGTASDSGDNDLELRPANVSKFAMREGSAFRFSVWVRKAPGETTHPKVRLQLQFFGEDGSFNTSDEMDFDAGSDWDDWKELPWSGTIDNNTAFVWPLIKIRGNGVLCFDAVSVVDGAAASTEPFIESTQYLDTVSVLDVFAPGDAEYDAHVSGGRILQRREKTVEVPEIVTRDKAEIFGRVYLQNRALPLVRKQVTTYRFKDFWPGDIVRAVGSGRGFLSTPLPVTEVIGRWDGKLSLTAYLSQERVTETRLLRELIEKERRKRVSIASGGTRPKRFTAT